MLVAFYDSGNSRNYEPSEYDLMEIKDIDVLPAPNSVVEFFNQYYKIECYKQIDFKNYLDGVGKKMMCCWVTQVEMCYDDHNYHTETFNQMLSAERKVKIKIMMED